MMRRAVKVRILYVKNLFLPALFIFFILCLILFPKSVVASASKGISLWINVVFPSLFPFFVGADLLNRSGIIRALGVLFEPIMRPLFNVPGCGSFPFVMGITSGYPVGAKLTTSMREDKMLSKLEAERLLAFSNNSGPLFIIGAVAVGMYNLPELGIFLLCCHILACITVGILFRFYGIRQEKRKHRIERNLIRRFKKEIENMNAKTDLGTMFGNAIKDSISTILAIGGFIIFFSVIINLLLELGIISIITKFLALFLLPLGIDKDIIASLISGLFEITTGTSAASKAATAPFVQKLIISSAIIGWAGFSVHLQVLSIISKTDINIKPYLIGKLLQGIIAACYTYIAIKFLHFGFENYTPTYIPWSIPLFNAGPQTLMDSLKYFSYSLPFLILCTIITISVRSNPKSHRKGLR